MRTMHQSIGANVIALILVLGWCAGTVDHAVALTSTSYQLNPSNGYATGNGGTSTNYATPSAALTWYQDTLTSTSYQLANGNFGSSASEESGSTGGTGGGTGGSSTPHGSRGDRAGTVSTSQSSSSIGRSAASSSSARSQAPVVHPAAPVEVVSSSAERVGETPPLIRDATDTTSTAPDLHFFDAIGEVRRDTTETLWMPWIFIVLSIIITLLNGTLIASHDDTKKRTKKQKLCARRLGLLALLVMLCGIIALTIPLTAEAENITTPLLRSYNGTLLDSSGNPVTSAVSVRFSYWKSADFVTTDTTGTGAINTGAAEYVGWQEVQTVTPTSKGSFSLNLGAVTSLIALQDLPASTLSSLYLQVEVKPSSSADTAYELLDTDSASTTNDRSQITAVPFARNTDLLDQHDTGTGSSNIPVLSFGGFLPISTMGSGTNLGTFTIDANNTETSEIVLQFGTTLGKKLTYDIVDNVFRFNASVEVEGNLTVSGLINGVDISSLAGLSDALKASSGGGLALNVGGGSYRLNGTVTNYAGGSRTMAASATNYVFFGSGGLTSNVGSFPNDEAYIPVAEVATSGGAILSIDDRRITSNDDRERSITTTFNPNYEKATYQGDGVDNIGQLSTSHDSSALRNFYLWTSTRTTLQDYDLIVRIPVSADFIRWQSDATTNPISLSYRTTSASSALNKLDIQIYDSSGVPVTLSGSVSNLAGTSWATTQIEFSGSPTWTAGTDILVRVKFYAKDGYEAHLGALKLHYVDLARE